MLHYCDGRSQCIECICQADSVIYYKSFANINNRPHHDVNLIGVVGMYSANNILNYLVQYLLPSHTDAIPKLLEIALQLGNIDAVTRIILLPDINTNYVYTTVDIRGNTWKYFDALVDIACRANSEYAIHLLINQPNISVHYFTFQNAIAYYNINIVAILWDKIKDNDITHYYEAIHLAIIVHQTVDVISLAINLYRIDINYTYHGNTLLYLAVEQKHYDVIKMLLVHPDIDVNKLSFNNTALGLACGMGLINVVEMLLCHSDINVEN